MLFLKRLRRGEKKLTVMVNFNAAVMSRKKSFVPMRFLFSSWYQISL